MPLSINALFFVGLGGAIGAITRYIISINFINNGQQFPWGTFIANIIGAFIIACLYVVIVEKSFFSSHLSDPLRQLLVVGFLGALTTFSSFSLESVLLFNNNHYQLAITYIISTLVCCLAITFVTIKMSRSIF